VPDTRLQIDHVFDYQRKGLTYRITDYRLQITEQEQMDSILVKRADLIAYNLIVWKYTTIYSNTYII